MRKTHSIHFASIPSTNTWAKEHLELLPKELLTIVSAEEQTAGRGRQQRLWHSPSGENLYATFCFFVDQNFPYLANMAQMLALCAVELVQAYDICVKLKWPNDILTNSGKKIGGVLCETVFEEGQICVLLGIGLNVNATDESLKTIKRPASSLLLESGKKFDVKQVQKLLQELFLANLDKIEAKGIAPFLEAYRAVLQHRSGEKLSFHSSQGTVEGTFDSIAADGSLNLRMPNGSLCNFFSGEIES